MVINVVFLHTNVNDHRIKHVILNRKYIPDTTFVLCHGLDAQTRTNLGLRHIYESQSDMNCSFVSDLP
jgi:hypothetical protein